MKTIIRLSLVFQLFFALLLMDVKSQVTQQWVGYYNSPTNGRDEVRDMAVDNAGNVYLTGISSTSSTGNDFATLKYNSAGVLQWSARYNSQLNYSDIPIAMTVDGNGNSYVTGSNSLGGAYGLTKIVKYNSSGIQQWTARCGDSIYNATAAAIVYDASGNIYIGGSIQAYRFDDGSFHLKKFSAAGDSIWKRTYDPSEYPQGSGSSISCLKINGNFIYAAGKCFNTAGLFTEYASMTLIKYDLNGNHQWIEIDSLINGSDNVIDMELDPSGNIYVLCSYYFDMVLFKFNPAGDRMWKKLYTGVTGDYYNIPAALDVDLTGNVIVTGTSFRSSSGSSEDYVTLKYDPSGNLLWEKLYNGTLNSGDYSYDVTTDLSNNVYITGISYETGFDFNAVTIKYNSSGVQQWMIRFDGGNNENHDEGNFIKVDAEGNVIIAGYSTQAGHVQDFMAVKYSQSVGVTQISSNVPSEFSLSQNYPNPFNPVTNLEFGIAKLGYVSLKVYDINGREVVTLVNKILATGLYKYNFDALNLPSGIYFYKLTTDAFSQTKKMNLIK